MKSKILTLGLTLVLALCLVLPQLLLAGTTGKISGKIIDEETKEPLPGVAVSIVGTTMGGLTNEKGEYFIINVPVGTYTLKAQLIGFAPVEITNVKTSVDLTSYTDFTLSKKALELGKTIIVTAQRPLIIKDQTSSIKLVESEQIQNMPTRGYQDIVGLQAGVVAFRDNPNTRARGARENTNSVQLNIRGGRNNEVAYYVDGFSQQDPLSGISTTSINNNALSEVEITTGGFSAEYGWVSSGIINVTTKEGASKYSGALEAITDNITNRKYDYNNYDANLGGPIPGLNGSTFFVSGERRWQGDRSPSSAFGGNKLPYNALGGWTGQGNVSFKLNDNMNIKMGGLYSHDIWQEYRHAYFFDAAHTPKYDDVNGSAYFKWTHTLSPKTFYNAAVSYFVTERIRGDGVLFKDLPKYANPAGNPNFDETGLFYTSSLISGVENTDHIWDDFLHRKSRYFGVDASITSQVTHSHLLKAGFEYQRHNLRFYDHLFPTNPNSIDYDHYGFGAFGNMQDDATLGPGNAAKKPITWALYAQDKFEWNDLVINAGLRFDYFNAETDRVKDITNPFDAAGNLALEPSVAQKKVSPRVGLAFPVSDKTVVHMNFGKFFQRPNLQYLYVGSDYYTYKVKQGGYYYAFGNPNLEPEKTTSYEFGISHQLGDYTSFDATAYYKDVGNLTEVVTIPAKPKQYALYSNSDFGTIKGLDFALNMRRIHNMTLNLSYSLSWANGTGSFANTQQNIAWVVSEKPLVTAPLDFDQRHKLTAVLDVRTGKGEGPKFGNFRPLENTGVNFIADLSSGTPYSPVKTDADPVTLFAVSFTPAAATNSRNIGWRFRIDMKASKTLYVAGGANIDFYVWILNLLDRKNPVAVYETSGSPVSTDWLNTQQGLAFIQRYGTPSDGTGLTGEQKYLLRQNDPANYDIPRQIRFGVRMSF